VDVARLRRAANELLPLLAERDPGAKDCLKANRTVLRSALPSETFEQLEQLVKTDAFELALEHLGKAVRKHGIHV
jgi:hypothetical protein